jgi:threonine dehydratase
LTPQDPAVDRDYLERILKARVYDVAIESPLEPAARLSRRLGASVLFKREDLQPVFSFKLRGAYNKMAQLPRNCAARGVVCASAGNHAQGVALAARQLGVPALVVMPATTPQIKVAAVGELGAEIELHGDDYDAAYQRALERCTERSATLVPPFDDPDVIAGQGTIAMEILRQHDERLDAIFVPVGGGGLIGGIACYVKALYPQIRIVGVEPEDAASMHSSLAAGKRITLDRVGIFADGVAVRTVGAETFRLAQRHVDEIVLVSTDEICAAIQDIFEDTRAIAEPAGALAVAGLKRYAARQPLAGATYVTVNSGANMNFDRLRHVAERADLGGAREVLLAVEIPERPGSFLAFCELLGQRSVTEFNYRFANPSRAHVFVGLALAGGAAEKQALLSAIAAGGFPAVDMSADELAKLHVRYMVGGLAPAIRHERLFRFEFPERPGALLRFLRAIGSQWNISLFHYRNHGSDYGRVLAGIQVPPETDQAFVSHLTDLRYRYTEETGSPAYRTFLAAG